MKILQVCFKDPLVYKGGLESVIVGLSENLKKIGHDVDILCTTDNKNKEYIKNTSIGKIILIKTPNFYFLGEKRNLIKKVIYNYKLKSFIKKNGYMYDIIHVHGDSGGCKIFRKFNTVATFHGFTASNPLYKNIFKRFFLYLFSARYEFNNLKYSKKITSVSKKVAEQIQNYTNKKINVVYNGIDLKKFNSFIYKTSMKKKLKFKKDNVYILFVGTQAWRKGLDIALEAMNLLKNNRLRLNIIGLKTNKLNNNFVTFHGLLNEKQIIRYYKASDIFIMPSRYEGFSIAVLEAMASGLPVIASNNIGLDEIIKNNFNGILIENNPNELAKIIKKLLINRKLLNKISYNSYQTSKKFDWANIVKKYIEIYNEI